MRTYRKSFFETRDGEVMPPNSRVAFYNDRGEIVEVVEVYSLYPELTAKDRAWDDFPDLADKATSAAYIGPVR